MIERINSPGEQPDDNSNLLRPIRFDQFVGQNKLIHNLKVYIKAALTRGEPLDHCLLCGPPGLGKTTLSQIIAKEMRANVKSTSAPAIEKTGDIASLLTSLEAGDVLFIDEIHRLRPVVEEVLYSAMEDFNVDVNLGQGVTAKTVKINLAPFTLIGATTKPGSLTQPLISRFGIIGQFEFYNVDDLLSILKNNAAKLKIQIEEKAMMEIAKRSRFTPRILNRLLKRVRDYSEVQGERVVSMDVVLYALEKMEIDELGLDNLDRRYLSSLVNHYKGGPAGVENIAAYLSEDSTTLEDMVEPFLIQAGFVKRSNRGRIATPECYKYLGKKEPHHENTFFNR